MACLDAAFPASSQIQHVRRNSSGDAIPQDAQLIELSVSWCFEFMSRQSSDDAAAKDPSPKTLCQMLSVWQGKSELPDRPAFGIGAKKQRIVGLGLPAQA